MNQQKAGFPRGDLPFCLCIRNHCDALSKKRMQVASLQVFTQPCDICPYLLRFFFVVLVRKYLSEEMCMG